MRATLLSATLDPNEIYRCQGHDTEAFILNMDIAEMSMDYVSCGTDGRHI